ncbi:MAG: TraM recognition domain-containing protein [Pirellulales bacterium]
MWNLIRKRPQTIVSRWDLSRAIMQLTRSDTWTIGDACQGCQILGTTGSGKSTGSLSAIIGAFLLSGFGGIFFTSKPSDCATYLQLCEIAGRGKDVMIFGPNQPYRFNALDAELHRSDAGSGQNQSIVTLLTTLLEVNERVGTSFNSEGYWQNATEQLIRNGVDALVMGKDRCSVPELFKVVTSAPTSFEQLASPEWCKNSYCCQCLREADARTKDPVKRRDLELTASYFLNEFPALSDRTRSCIVSMFTSMADVLNRGLIRELISDESNISPEMMQHGKIIIVDLPTFLFGSAGTFLQVLWKYCTQRAQERRDIAANPRPVFMVADESHHFAVKQDQIFQTTARSTRTAVVCATQSISNYLAMFGEHSESLVHSLLGNLSTQIFHQQTDIKTNTYAADLIGRTKQLMINANSSYQPGNWFESLLDVGNNQTVSSGVNEVYEYEVQPSVFNSLRKGGAPLWTADAIVYQGGRQFSQTGRPWTPVTFKQQLF